MVATPKLRIYIAGPYTASDPETVEAHVTAAIIAGLKVFEKGHYPYIPHLTHYIQVLSQSRHLMANLRWEDYMEWDRGWLDVSDAILFLGPSRGADIELKRASALGKRIFRDISEIPDCAVRP